jgi:hypothetical protein
VSGWGRIVGSGEDRGREWIRRGKRVVWMENNGLYHKRMEKSEGSKNIVMAKLIIQKRRRREKHQVCNNKKFSPLGESCRVIPLLSNSGIGTWCSRINGEGC